jgi:hypothetical protein
VRDPKEPFPTIRAGLASGPVFDRIAPFASVGFETGRARRERGDVTTYAIALGLGGRWRMLRGERMALDVVGSGALAYAIARGTTAHNADLASSTSGAAAEFAVGLSPAVAVGRTEVFLEPMVGTTFPRLSARVTDEAPVLWSGFWLGATLGVRFGGRT